MFACVHVSMCMCVLMQVCASHCHITPVGFPDREVADEYKQWSNQCMTHPHFQYCTKALYRDAQCYKGFLITRHIYDSDSLIEYSIMLHLSSLFIINTPNTVWFFKCTATRCIPCCILTTTYVSQTTDCQKLLYVEKTQI